MTILVDMDGVMGKDFQYALELYNEEYNSYLTVDDFSIWEIDKEVPEGTSILKYYFEKGFFDKLEPMDNSIEVLEKLHDMGHEIIIVTASPPNGVVDKMKWLEEYYPFLKKENIIVTSRKDLIYGDVIIDDKLENVVYSRAKQKILFSAFHNENIEDYDDIKKVNNWLEIEKLLLTIPTNTEETISYLKGLLNRR